METQWDLASIGYRGSGGEAGGKKDLEEEDAPKERGEHKEKRRSRCCVFLSLGSCWDIRV